MKNLIKPYNKKWKQEFEILKTHLLDHLKGLDIEIQHIGSTAIPEIYAKPILDIDIIIEDKNLLNSIEERLKIIGYTNYGELGIPGRFAFKIKSDHTSKVWMEHHLYVCFSDSVALKNHLSFRDILLKDKDLREQYSTLKLNILNQKNLSREDYTKQKTAFVLSILEKNGFEKLEIEAIKKANE